MAFFHFLCFDAKTYDNSGMGPRNYGA